MKPVSIFISSFDGFSDCWKPYYHGLQKYWPDCPYEIFITTNFKESGDASIRTIKVGEDKGWSRNTLHALSKITSPYIIYTHEDFWINHRVQTHIIEEYVDMMDKGRADYIRLFPCPEPDYEHEYDKRLGVLADNAAYRTSLQVAIWRKSVFQELIVEEENPWQFETQGTIRSKKYGPRFLSVRRFYDAKKEPFHYGIDYVCTAINKGKWSKAAKIYASQEGLAINFSNRPHETSWHDFVRSTLFGASIGRIFIMPKRVKKYLF